MSSALCSLCRTAIVAGEPMIRCPSCRAPAHAECWAESGGCGTYGCSRALEQEQQASAQPASWWGRDNKTCPSCGKEIKAAALRCRHCSAQFPSEAPMSRSEFDRAAARKADRLGLERWAPVLFVAGIIPPTAPLALIIGGGCCLVRRERFRAARPFSRMLALLGLAFAALWLLVGLLIGVLAWLAAR